MEPFEGDLEGRCNMSTGKIEVWITGQITFIPFPPRVLIEPCRVNEGFWYVSVWDCCRNPLQWCGSTNCYATKCGQVEIEVPPGCYYLRAALFERELPPDVSCQQAEPIDVTGVGIATVGCGQEVCVTLLPLKIHYYLAHQVTEAQLSEEARQMQAGKSQ